MVARINKRFALLQTHSDAELTDAAMSVRNRIEQGDSLFEASVVAESFALVKEAARRTIGQEHYDVQLLAGLAMATGAIAEMQTGEGKTLASTLPAVLHGFTGNGVHIATVNSYLAERDFNELSPLYELLGLTVGYARDGDSIDAKRRAYACAITYATGYELGFDYLRDQIALKQARRHPIGQSVKAGLRGANRFLPMVQRGHTFAVIDEIDSVLLDEANTPLILSSGTGNEHPESCAYHTARRIASQLRAETDFILDSSNRSVRLTQVGASRSHLALQADEIARESKLESQPSVAISSDLSADSVGLDGRKPKAMQLVRPWTSYVEQALRAEHLCVRDNHYVVQDGEVQIVDEYTGRIFSERSWRDGLHQAVEAKEDVSITQQKRSLARISRQRYFQLYERLCGMTGTAAGHESEFERFYRLPVVTIPPRKPCRRKTLPTRYFAKEAEKWAAISDEIAARHRRGQPVLIGTRTIANSRQLAALLTRSGIPFRLLNGTQNEDEAQLISTAGEVCQVTIATNMAGRGTDIVPSNEAIARGGLHVIAAERHNSQRIDRQLAGRTARQGNPGSCQSYVSAEDNLIQTSRAKVARFLKQAPGDQSPTHVDAAIGRMQSKCEQQAYETRKQLLNHELWLDQLRATIA